MNSSTAQAAPAKRIETWETIGPPSSPTPRQPTFTSIQTIHSKYSTRQLSQLTKTHLRNPENHDTPRSRDIFTVATSQPVVTPPMPAAASQPPPARMPSKPRPKKLQGFAKRRSPSITSISETSSESTASAIIYHKQVVRRHTSESREQHPGTGPVVGMFVHTSWHVLRG